jgi:uncharacterized protein (TIGR03437 family)
VASITAVNAQSAPTVTYVENSASFQPPELPAGAIAQGSIFTLWGTGLGPASCSQAPAFPLPTVMCGVSLAVTVNGASSSPIFLGIYNGGQQINAILPSSTPTGTGTVTATYNNQTSAIYPIQVTDAAFGSFTANGEGFGQASVTDGNYVLNTIIHPLHPGDVGILWGTGLGAISASDALTPPVGNVGSPTVYVGSTALAPVTQLLYAGRSGSWPGLDQINFIVPPGVNGCYVPIAVQTNGDVGNIGTIAVAPAGQNTCSDSLMGQDLVNKLAAGNPVSFADIRLERNAGVIFNMLGDNALATFSQFYPQNAFFAEYGVSSGYCISNHSTPLWMSDSSLFAATLDAGSELSLLGYGPVNKIWASDAAYGVPGYYPLQISSSAGFYFRNGTTYTVSSTGGADVGPFSVSLTTPASITGLTQFPTSAPTVDQIIPRSNDFTVQWSGGDPSMQNGNVTVGAYSETADFNYWASFQCTAPLAAHSFTIPSWVLSALPQTGMYPIAGTLQPVASIWIGQYSAPVEFTAPGLDRGIITDVFYRGMQVNFQ